MARSPLSRDAVIDLALAELDAQASGALAELSLAAIAARAGVATPSLYKHVPSLAAVRTLVAVRCVDELSGVIGRATVGLSGVEAVAAMANAIRGHALANPARYLAAQPAVSAVPSANDSPEALLWREASERAITIVASVLRGFHLADGDVVDAIRVVRSAIHGFVALESAGAFGLPESVDRSFALLVRTVCAGISDLADRPASMEDEGVPS